MKTKYVLRNKRKFFTAIAILIITIVSIFCTSVYGYKEPTMSTITVNKGDTLWSIAERYCKSGDIREFIYEFGSLTVE